jgi:hypothetical protein
MDAGDEKSIGYRRQSVKNIVCNELGVDQRMVQVCDGARWKPGQREDYTKFACVRRASSGMVRETPVVGMEVNLM